MFTAVEFADNELAQLHLLVSQDAERRRGELHPTPGSPYREVIAQRLACGKSLRAQMNAARSGGRPHVRDTGTHEASSAA